MISDKYTYWPEEGSESKLIKQFCQYRGRTRHGDSALFNRDQYIIHRWKWVDGRGRLADSLDGVNITSICEYVNNRRHGTRWDFHDFASDKVKSQTSYRNDRKHGHHLKYYPSGEQECVGQHFAGEMHGQWMFFFDRADGDFSQWPVKERVEYEHGVLHGNRICFDRDGNVLTDEFYERGQQVYIQDSLYNHAIGLVAMSLPSLKNEKCPVCYEQKAGLELQCGHSFCQGCMIDWKKQESWDREMTCPMCRFVLY